MAGQQTADRHDVAIVGGGIAGLTAGTVIARGGFDALVLDSGDSDLARAAHVAALPGFPAGLNPRLLLHLLREGAKRVGCAVDDAHVGAVKRADGGFVVHAGDRSVEATWVVAASGRTVDYLEGLGLDEEWPLSTDADGRTPVEGLYAAGVAAGTYPQAAICAGSGARAAVSLLEDGGGVGRDWVVPEGYFTGRGLEVPPGCVEIDEDERERRERESMAAMERHFASPHPWEPAPPPDDEDE